MDKFFHSTFDFFTHAIPGLLILAFLFLLDPGLKTAHDLLEITGKITAGSGALLLIVSYIIGFAIHPLGRFLYKNVGFFFWRRKILNNVDLFISDKYVLLREYSPANFKYVETWNMYCAMAHNLAVASIIMLLVTLGKIIFQHPSFLAAWIGLAIFALIGVFIFLHRAVVFSIWAAHDINASVKSLNLVERGKIK